MRRRALPLLLAVLLPARLGGQEAPPDTATPADPLAQAMALAAAGDVAAALAQVEALAAQPDAPPEARAALGALQLEAGRPQQAYETLRPMAAAENAGAAVLYNAGRAAAALGETIEAEAWLTRSLAIEAGTPAQRELALLVAGAGRYGEAYPLLKPWVASRPEDEEARLIAALCAVQLQRPNEAEGLLADLPQDRPQVQLLWARVRQLEGDPWGAIALLEPLSTAAPPAMQGDVRRQLARAYAAVGQASRAVELLQGQVGSDPGANLQLAQAQYQSGDLDAALATLAPLAPALLAEAGRAPAVPPLAIEILREHGRLLVTAGRQPEALAYLETATRLDPENKEGWHQYGQALAASGRQAEAKAALERFEEILNSEVPDSLEEVQLEKDLEDPTGRELRRAMTLAARERYDEALAIVEREAALVPDDPRPPLVGSRILLLADRPEEALAVAEAVAESLPDNADAVYQRGAVRVALDDLAGAEADLRRALELAPEHTAAMSDLAVLLAGRGEKAEARDLLERVLALRPDDAVAKASLAGLGGE